MGYNLSYQRDAERQRVRRAALDADPPLCGFCSHAIPKPRRYVANARYCNERCKKEMQRKKAREKAAALDEAAKAGENFSPDDLAARLYSHREAHAGPVYDAIKAEVPPDLIEAWIDAKVTHTDIAKHLTAEFSPQAIGKARNQFYNDRISDIAAGRWKPKDRYAEMLGTDDMTMKRLMDPDDPLYDPQLFDDSLDALVGAFVDWRDEFFAVGYGQRYITKAFHKKWIRATLRAIYLGGRQLILSPPRHGKTDLLIHFCVWLICRNPDVKILWVGPNEDIGKNCLGMVKELLSSHDELREAFLPPGKYWAPQKRGGLWASDKFTVQSRITPQKQPTMWSTGVGGRILSLDADFIIVDDPADPDASYTEGGRDKIDNWFKVKLASRKMDHTGLVMISSRVHPDDLYSQFIDHDRWETIVDKAHDHIICGLDLFDDHNTPDPDACVLFPEINPLRYLQEQADVVGMALFEMMYLNQPRPNTAQIYDLDLIRTLCLDRSRDTGISGIPGHYRLVAGLDPAASGTQAAFLWACQQIRDPRYPSRNVFLYHMVDCQTQKAGGIEGALQVMRDWENLYKLDLWIVEDNAYQKVFFRDPRVKKLEMELGLTIKPTHTDHRNKYDPKFGVAAMAPNFHEGRVILPYASPEARRKVDAYLKSLAKLTTDEGPAKKGSDLAMASWFPFATVIRRWTKEAQELARVEADPHRSYPSYEYPSYDELPWGNAEYPF